MAIPHRYIVISEIDESVKVSKKVLPLFRTMKNGEVVTVKSILEKCNGSDFVKCGKTVVEESLKAACKAGRMTVIKNKTGIPDWFLGLETVAFWMADLRGSQNKNSKKIFLNTTKGMYAYHLWKFNLWLSGREFKLDMTVQNKNGVFVDKVDTVRFENVEELLRFRRRIFDDGESVAKIAKMYLVDGIHANKKAGSMNTIKYAILSYFEGNDKPIRLNYKPKSTHRTEGLNQKMTIPDLLKFLTKGRPSVMETAVYLCKFHRGLDASTLVDRFNYEAWDQMVKWFGTDNHNFWDLGKCPVPIELVRIKTSFMHTGFLERDAVEAVVEYLNIRKEMTGEDMRPGQPLFLNRYGRPITVPWVFSSFARISRRAGINDFEEFGGRKEYRMDSHELRDLLKSTLIACGCRYDVCEHVIGHKPRDSYEKQNMLYPEILRKEYAKAATKINIFTKFATVVTGSEDVDEARMQTAGKLAEIEKIKNDMLVKNAMIEREKIMMEEIVRRLSEMEKRLDSSENSPQNRGIEFCCFKCGLVHDLDGCPSCGSKMRRLCQ